MTSVSVESLLRERSTRELRPDGSAYRRLLFSNERAVVEATGLSHRQVQEAALQLDIVPQRYIRNQLSLSSRDQLMLLHTKIAVVGLGGLGGAVVEILARIGIGRLTLIDGDHFEDSNLNRQLLSSVADLGRLKAEVAACRVAAINPAVHTETAAVFLGAENGLELVGRSDIVIDCLDSIADRFVLEMICRQAAIPMVSAAIGGSMGQVTVIYPGDEGLARIYGDPAKAPKKGVEQVRGSLPYTAVTLAAYECQEAVILALGRKSPLRRKLFVLDLADYCSELLDMQAEPGDR